MNPSSLNLNLNRNPDQTLELFPPPPPELNVRWLEDLLLGRSRWMTARDIELTTRGNARERLLRELASASPNIISGQKGYAHIANASAEEIDHAAAWLLSQGKKMIKRSIAIRRNGHRRLG